MRINCRCYDVEREGCTRYTCVAVSPPRAGRLRVLVLIFTRYVALYVPALLWVPARSRLGELFGNKGGGSIEPPQCLSVPSCGSKASWR